MSVNTICVLGVFNHMILMHTHLYIVSSMQAPCLVYVKCLCSDRLVREDEHVRECRVNTQEVAKLAQACTCDGMKSQ